RNPGYQHEAGNSGFKDFQIDQRNKCVFLEGHKVDLTPKEFELVVLLSTDVDRIFMADEIIKHIWPENNRATKSDLYQYMHLLRKKIEKDPNNPQWIMTVKGFGYKLNIGNSVCSAANIHKRKATLIRRQNYPAKAINCL
ncbi:MAG: helix-turn-helix domain-containing protein, partial [Methylococcaceae bacterium]|nr:helix-turn-helix domain-containing protein [Methylococcaceae bacterium]